MPKSSRCDAPYWKSECGRTVVYIGDCLQVLQRMEEYQFHSVVTDPPYGLEFMGRDWDAPWKSTGMIDANTARASEMSDPVKAKYLQHKVEYGKDSRLYQEWFLARVEQLFRVSRPGAHFLSFGGTRMWHRAACAIEDAGYEIRDTIMWVYGNGFPKSMDVSKAIDKHLGAERQPVGRGSIGLATGQFNRDRGADGGYGFKDEFDVTEPATDEARQWRGWGTCLKPAVEPIVLARRPPVGSVARNVIERGCGGINVDGCKVGTTGTEVKSEIRSKTSTGSGIYQFNSGEAGSVSMNGGYSEMKMDGRLPANLIHDGSPEVIESLPEGAARYFYSAKADDSDRSQMDPTIHPTVKPLDLMRYLVRLVTPKGGTVLDPFMGSGSTGCAAVAEGVYFVGVEQSKEYADLAIDRLKEMLGVHTTVERLASGKRVVKDVPPPPKKLR